MGCLEWREKAYLLGVGPITTFEFSVDEIQKSTLLPYKARKVTWKCLTWPENDSVKQELTNSVQWYKVPESTTLIPTFLAIYSTFTS